MIVDLFAGGGGASTGIEAATGRRVDVAIDHNPMALAVHAANHPGTLHLTTDVWEVDPVDVTKGREVELLWASPDCCHFSRAKGGKPLKKKIRSLAWVVTRWAKAVRPALIFVENVPELKDWGPLLADGRPCKKRKGKTFKAWIARLQNLGYRVEWRVLDASLFGAPTRRKRLFIVAARDGAPITWPEPTHGKGRLPLRTAAECSDWSIPCTSIFDRVDARTGKKLPPLAEKTMWRIAKGLRRYVFESAKPFILKVNHGGREDRSEDINQPLTTVIATQRGHALVLPVLQHSGNGEREGQRARSLDIQAPLGTLMATGQKHALVAAWLVKHFGDPLRTDGGGGVVVGSDLRDPVGTVTARDHHSLAAVTLAHFRGFRLRTRSNGRFADGYDLSEAKTKKDKVFLLGNSVCPEVAEALVRANVPRMIKEAA